MFLGLSLLFTAFTSVLIGNAFYQKQQFFPAVLELTKSNASMIVIYAQSLVCLFMLGILLRKIFLGILRKSEFQHLMLSYSCALMDFLLALSEFQNDFNRRSAALFTIQIFIKTFHWLADKRLDFMLRSPMIGRILHLRIAALLIILGAVDYVMLVQTYETTALSRGSQAHLFLGFEYIILMTILASSSVKYLLYVAMGYSDAISEKKSLVLLYTATTIGMTKVLLYSMFVFVMFKYHSLPFFLFLPTTFAIHDFTTASANLVLSQRAIELMDTLYPDATPEELHNFDHVCIICWEVIRSNAKKLPCDHIFHIKCLRSWFERQQTCPTCRFSIFDSLVPYSTTAPRRGDAASASRDVALRPRISVERAAVAPSGNPLDNWTTLFL